MLHAISFYEAFLRLFWPVLLGSLYAATSFGAASAQAPAVTGDSRVDEILSHMTLSEKRSLIHDSQEDPATYQGQAGYIAGIPRLGIPGLRLADGPPGVLTRHPSEAETATLGLAATFDIKLAEENGVVIGREAHALGVNVALQPFINIDRDVSFRRMYNTYGEDSLLTSAMGAAVIKGIQSQHVMAMAKHFIGYDGGGSDIWIDDQTLHEIYLPPFEAAVKAGVAAVMCSYNHINGPYACGNRHMLTDTLRGALGFKGFVVSDWGASHSADFMNAGLEVEMIDGPDSTGYQEPAFLGAVPAALPPKADAFGEPMGDIYGGIIPEEPVVPDNDTNFGAKVPPRPSTKHLPTAA
jgi:beta-glucosidase